MRIKLMLKSIRYLLVITIMFQIAPCALAHKVSQEGILTKEYNLIKEKEYIGGEDIGWFIDEDFHTNGTKIYYKLSQKDIFYVSKYKNNIANGATNWNNIVTITEGTGSVTGEIYTVNNPNTTMVAETTLYSSILFSGHAQEWKMEINRAKTITSTTIAHEFGHVIGLKDMATTKNKNTLMYGYEDRTVLGPSNPDRMGALLISGQHSSHTWGYKFYRRAIDGTTSHIKFCTICNGVCASANGKDPLVDSCTYNSAGICTACKARKQEISINSINQEIQ